MTLSFKTSIFLYLEQTLTNLFSIDSTSSFRCEQYIFAKNYCVPFKISITKSSIPCTHIYTDVWDPFSTLIVSVKYIFSLLIIALGSLGFI